MWRSGALFGTTPAEAFYVKCDAETNPPELRELGQVVTEIGVAIVRPAEFVIFRISQFTAPCEVATVMPTLQEPRRLSRDVFLKPEARLATGVPGFVGFANGAGEASRTCPSRCIARRSSASHFVRAADSFLGDAVAGFFDNGGDALLRGQRRRAAARIRRRRSPTPSTRWGRSNDLDLVAVPDAMASSDEAIRELVQRQARRRTARTHGDRLAILDALPAATTAKVLAQRDRS